jgi:curved DNA-binding protein CbpA
MPLDAACAVLKVEKDYTHETVKVAFRRQAKKAHPDVGGRAEQFRALVAARDRLLATLGT